MQKSLDFGTESHIPCCNIYIEGYKSQEPPGLNMPSKGPGQYTSD